MPGKLPIQTMGFRFDSALPRAIKLSLRITNLKFCFFLMTCTLRVLCTLERVIKIGAHVLYNTSLQRLMQTPIPTPPCVPIPGWLCLSDCLLAAAQQGGSNSACLDAWLQKRNIASLDYFEYEKKSDALSHEVDACQVFSGPAGIDGDVGLPFRICLDHYGDTGICTLPLIVWSGRSTNKVPVGVDHSTVIADPQLRRVAAYNAYAAIQNDVQTALDAAGQWNATDLKVTVFSAEGDMLHQYFDCMMMGALDSVDLWPGLMQTSFDANFV